MTTDINLQAGASRRECARVAAELDEAWGELRCRVDDEFAKAGVGPDQIDRKLLVRMQYAGQLNDIEVAAGGEGPDGVAATIEAFETAYGKIYAKSARSPELGYTITSAIVTGSTPVEKPTLPVEDEGPKQAEPKETRRVWWTDGFVETPVYDQETLRAGVEIEGPGIVEASSSTFVIPPNRSARLDPNRIFHLR
ncbi:MAG: hypothetical protein R2691_05115 [Solirubrobacterales bacterium]